MSSQVVRSGCKYCERRVYKIHTTLLLFFIGLCSSPGLLAAAESDEKPPKISWEIGQHEHFVDQAKQTLSNFKDPKTDDVIRLISSVNVSISDSEVVETTEVVYYYPTQISVQNSGADTISWDWGAEDLTVMEAASIQTSGSVQRLDINTVEILDGDSLEVFTDNRNVVMHLPGIEPGSMAVIVYQRKLRDPKDYLYNFYTASSLYTHKRKIGVNWHGNKPNIHIEEGDLNCQISKNNLVCTGENLQPGNFGDDVEYRDVLQKISIANVQTWDDVISDIKTLVDGAKVSDKEFQRLTQEAQLSTDQLSYAFELASRKIRYVSFSAGEHSHKPHKISATLANKYGDCKDKSTVLYAMLEALGVNAYPVLVATQRNAPERLVLPSKSYFDHMVVCAKLDEGERCFDPTEINSGTLSTSYVIQGKVRLNLLPGSTPSNIPSDNFRWKMQVDNLLAFNADGGQEEQLSRKYIGPYAAWMRGVLSSRSTRERTEWLEEQYAEVVSQAKNLKFEVLAADETNSPLTINSSAKFDDLAKPNEPLDYGDGAFWIKNFVKDQKSSNKMYPYTFNGFSISSRYVYDFNSLWRLSSAGATVTLDSVYGTYHRNYEPTETGVVVTSRVEMPKRKVPVAELKQFNRWIDLVLEENAIKFWGTKQTASSPD